MCGFTGFLGQPQSSEMLLREIQNMEFSLKHRGPNDSGIWLDLDSGLALAHRRLSIIDLSAAGHQPMISPCERYVLAYNGEVYNHASLRQQLEREGGAFAWRGYSDTETLLAGLRHWGIEACLQKLNGMFAFALWDRLEKQLILARDRMGEKPVYYGRNGNNILFGSELKALVAHSEWRGEIDRNALSLFMRYNHVPGTTTIYLGISKLPPAHYVTISGQGGQISEPKAYWSLAEVAHSGLSDPGDSTELLADELDLLLRDAVGSRMLADVSLGAFLSGGYDSTMIVAQMQAQASRAVKTFSIGSEDLELDEAKHAAVVARHLGTEHTELYVTAQDALKVVPQMAWIYDEPFADSSQIPTFLVSQLARRDVTVALSGDGGDELFAGYNRHIAGPNIWKQVNRIPFPLRCLLGNQLSQVISGSGRGWLKYLPRRLQYPNLSLKLSKLAAALEARQELEFYDLLRAHWKHADLVLDGSISTPYSELENADLLEQMMFQDMQTYLPDDILVKVDRASMAVSLEARVPFLDHRLVEFAWRLPSHLKVRDGKGKWLLREVLTRYIPSELMERPKQGFSVPIAQWMREPLRDWAETLLNESRLKQEGYLNASQVRSAWKNHLAGRGHHEHDLWCVLMFQAWLETQKR